MIFYLIPATAYASLFEASETESVTSENTARVGEVFEDVSRREENVKHFRLEDGTYMAAQYDTAVHTLDENGKWQDIDNTLSASGSEYTTSNSRIKFAKKITGNESIFTLHENNRKITLSLDGAIKKTSGVATNTETEFDETATTLQKMMTLDKLSSRIIYENILDGVDLEYIVVSNNVKENIIVKEKKDTYSYSFTLKLNNLVAYLSPEGDVEISDPDSEEVLYIIPAPVVYDANMTYASEGDAYYTLESVGQNEYRLTVTAGTEWMNAFERAFPVTIDPTIYYGGYNMRQMCDALVSQNYPNSAFGSRTYLKVGYDNVNANLKAYVAMRSLPTLPAGSMITGAKLNLICNGASEGNFETDPLTLVAKKITRNSTTLWSETSVTYGNSTSFDEEASVIDYVTISETPSSGGVACWNITPAVVDWYANNTNQGISISQYDANDTTVHTVQFHSSDNSMSGAYTPFFTISYVSSIGVESYYSYQSASAGLAGTGYVNTATGALAFVKPLLSTTDSLMPYTVTMTYNSEFAGKAYQYPNAQTAYSTSYMPYGFKLNINETIIEKKFTNDSAGETLYYIWSDSDGTEHAFFEKEDDVYIYEDEDGLQLTLTMDPQGEVYTLEDDGKTVRTFTQMSSNPSSDVYGAWYLTSITDKNNNEISFTVDSSLRPTGVNLTPNGSSTISFLTLVYNDDGQLSIIRNDTSKEAVVFRYSGTYNGDIATSSTKYLREIVYAHGTSSVTSTNWADFYNNSENTTNITVDAKATYTYDSSGRLGIVNDTLSGYRIDYTYSGEKVSAIQEYGIKNGTTYTAGQKIGLNYSNGYTEARISGTNDEYGDADDIITRYIFDNNGRAVGIYSTDSNKSTLYGATAGEYQKAEKVKNNLKTSTAVGGSATNYLLNGGFDTINSSTSAPYWTTTSSRVTYFSIGNTLDATCAYFTPAANTTDTLTQYTKLPVGTFTLSMSVSTVNCTGVRVFVDVASSSAGVNTTEEISINEQYASGFPYSFSMTFDNNVDNAIYSVTIRVVGGSFSDTDKNVSIDNVMLEKNIGNSSYSLVQMGSFDAFAVNSTGTPTATVGSYWQASSGTATVTASGNSLFGNAARVEGSINSEQYLKQRIYTANAGILNAYDEDAAYPNEATTFTLSAFALGTSQAYNNNSHFRIRVNVYYYEGSGNTDTVETKDFNFTNDNHDWQFICGSFTTREGGCVHYIDVICEYSYQPGGYALFDNIAVTESSAGSVVDYEYYDNSTPTLEGLLRKRKSGFNSEYYEYNSDRLITRIANNRGEIVDYTYASNGVDIVSEIYYAFTNGTGRFYPYLMPDPDAAIVKTPKYRTDYSYDDYGLLLSTQTYALTASLSCDTSEKYISTSATYLTESGSMLFGAILSTTDNLGRQTKYFYNTSSTHSLGDLMAVVNVSEGTGTCYTYDAIGNILTVQPCTYSEDEDSAAYTAVSGEENITYGYATADDPRNLLQSVTTGSTTYTFTYDDFGRSDSVSAGLRELASYEYNPNNGKIKKITYGNEFFVQYVYDELDNIKEVWYNKVMVYEYTYTAYGQLYRFDNHVDGTSTVYEYDQTGRLVHFTEFDSSDMVNDFSSLIYYDNEGRLSDYFYIGAYTNTSGVNDWSTYYYNDYLGDGRFESFSLDADGDITGETASATVNFTYDKYNRLTNKAYTYSASSQSFTGSVDYTFTETAAATSSQTATYTSTVNGSSVTSTYTYDGNGNITGIVLSTGAEYRYVYDDLGQLLREDNTVTDRTYVYTYDDAGNITSKKTYALTAR
ncbi:MAG: DNRLRE domain-containing protein, partial [Eubacteriales bacterium]